MIARQRQISERAVRQAKGTKFGRLTALDVGQKRKIAERYAVGQTMAELVRECKCGEPPSGGRQRPRSAALISRPQD